MFHQEAVGRFRSFRLLDKKPKLILDLTRLNTISNHGTPQMAAAKDAISLLGSPFIPLRRPGLFRPLYSYLHLVCILKLKQTCIIV